MRIYIDYSMDMNPIIYMKIYIHPSMNMKTNTGSLTTSPYIIASLPRFEIIVNVFPSVL